MHQIDRETSIDDVSTISPANSGYTTPSVTVENSDETSPDVVQKKKKKKKAKKTNKSKDEAPDGTKKADQYQPTVLCISRNKHWRYISSYHGPWLQLPLELLESLLVLNLDPATLMAPEQPRIPATPSVSKSGGKRRDRGFDGLGDLNPPELPRAARNTSSTTSSSYNSLPLPPPLPAPTPGKATPPPIDPGVFRSVTSIRRLIDEAAELSVRASSGLSAAELGNVRHGGSGIVGGNPWSAAQTLGINPTGGNGRSVAMSAMRVHRLRALAVQKLAQAYKADEIASSVMVMQGGSVFDDVAERVLKYDPNDIDAKYVHFFHEKIPSRQLAESTTTQLLDELIRAQPQRLEFYRTRGIVHCFRDEYPQAIKDFTHALKDARAVRKAKSMHSDRGGSSDSHGKTRKKKSGKVNGQAPPSGTSAIPDMQDEAEPLLLHPSVLPDAPEPIEPQLLFLRGAAYLQQAVFMIENAVIQLEGVKKLPTMDGAELRLCYLDGGKYGGVEIGNPDGPLGKNDGVKLVAYRAVLADETFREQILALLKKSVRDHEKFLGHFDTLTSQSIFPQGDLATQTEYAFRLSESIRPGNHGNVAPPLSSDSPTMFTTYHPLLVESHFSILISQLMQADFKTILPTFIKTAALVDGLEGYPVFLPPRSMAQAEFVEVLERLAGGWHRGIQAHSMSRLRAKERLAIEPIPIQKLPYIEPPYGGSRSSSSQLNGGGSSSSGPGSTYPSRKTSPTGTRQEKAGVTPRLDAVEALDCARILLSPVAARQRERAEKAAADKARNIKKPLQISIPLHGPRVEVILAWLAAVHMPEMEV